jgi:[acyl-carrier-protein] S-malonyltransferase
VLGHSLGEFTALVAAGALEFPRAVALVRERAQRMQAAVPEGVGAMAAILGLDDAHVIEGCTAAAEGEVVQAVNFNAPGQVIIAGHATAVHRAIAALKARGAKRSLVLPISVPAHSSLLEPAARALRPSIDAAGLRAPQIEFWSPADVARHASPDDIAALLEHQLAQPVHWSETINALIGAGVTRFVECGPGEVLAGLIRRIGKGRAVESLALTDPASIEAAQASQGAA